MYTHVVSQFHSLLRENSARRSLKMLASKSIETDSDCQAVIKTNYRYKNILANGSFPILLVVVCSLIIASIKCDQVVGSNEDSTQKIDSHDSKGKENSISQGSPSFSSTSKYDPLSFLREIYLDHDSKIITLLSPTPESDYSVQKFHPNGRYGRRSVNNQAEHPSAHTELGKLKFNAEYDEPLNSLLHSLVKDSAYDSSNSLNSLSKSKYKIAAQDADQNWKTASYTPIDYQSELGKILRCGYTGLSNLYWCETGK